MSILKAIHAAEEKAEQARQQAHDEVASLVEDTKESIKAKVKEMLDAASTQEKKSYQETTNKIVEEEKKIDQEYQKLDTLRETKALKKIEDISDYVLKKVLDI